MPTIAIGSSSVPVVVGADGVGADGVGAAGAALVDSSARRCSMTRAGLG